MYELLLPPVSLSVLRVCGQWAEYERVETATCVFVSGPWDVCETFVCSYGFTVVCKQAGERYHCSHC